jgi:tetratricopeptide (TPR) repeat protein
VRVAGSIIFAAMTTWCAAPEPDVAKAFDHFYNLEYDEALAQFRRAIERDPANPNFHNHLAQTVLYRDMFLAGALESELVTGNNPFLRRAKIPFPAEDTATFDSAVATAIELAQAKLKSSPKDTRAMYSLGVAYGLRANYNFLVRKAWLDALKDATQARKLHNGVTRLDAGFIDARLIQGVHDYVVGSLPWNWRFLGFLVGFRGDKETGVRTLKLVAEKGNLNRVDAEILLGVIYRRERRASEAVVLLTDLIRRYPRNFILRLEMVQMYADLGKKQEALDVLETLEKLKLTNAAGYSRLPHEKIYYSRGNLLFWYNDLDRALENLKRVTAKVQSVDLNTEMNAWLRQGQIHDMKGKRQEAIAAYKEAIRGAPDSDAARESRKYLDTPYRRG